MLLIILIVHWQHVSWIFQCQRLILFFMFNHWEFSLTDERVPSDLKKSIMQGRMDKKLTQAQLAQVWWISLHCQLVICILSAFIHKGGNCWASRWSTRSRKSSRSTSQARQSRTNRSSASWKGLLAQSCEARSEAGSHLTGARAFKRACLGKF